jgi:hypothetical protein
MPALPWYGYSREPQVMDFLLGGSRASQPIVLNGFLIFSRLDFLQTHVVIARFAEIHEKIVYRQGFEREAVRPPAMAGVD